MSVSDTNIDLLKAIETLKEMANKTVKQTRIDFGRHKKTLTVFQGD